MDNAQQSFRTKSSHKINGFEKRQKVHGFI